MMGALFFKECKQILKSLAFYIYIIILVLFLSTQLTDDEWKGIEKPVEGRGDYGTVISYDEDEIMKNMISTLVIGIENNRFDSYPLSFYKEVNLSEKELGKLKAYVEKCTGSSYDKVEEIFYSEETSGDVTINKELTMEQFKVYMAKVCDIIGKGSMFEESKIEEGTKVPMTYDDAVEEYNNIVNDDRITGAYARMFCDYAGIILALLPIFLGVTRCLRDKRSDVCEVIYSKNIASYKIILSRYFANVVMTFIPVIIMAIVIQAPYMYSADTYGVRPDYFAFIKYSFIWLFPEIMLVLGISFVITEFTDNMLAIVIQVVWGISSLISADTLQGNFGLKLIARWNKVGMTTQYFAQQNELLINRGILTLVSVAAIALTILIYDSKRKEGETLYGKLLRNR